MSVWMGIKPTMFKGVYLGLPLKIKVAQKNQVCEAMSLKQYELTKEQWERIKPLSPPEETGKWGRPRKDNRIMLNGMLWIIRSGAQWCELLKRSEPAGVPCWKTGPMVPGRFGNISQPPGTRDQLCDPAPKQHFRSLAG